MLTAAATLADLVSLGMLGIFSLLPLQPRNVQGHAVLRMGLRRLPMTAARGPARG